MSVTRRDAASTLRVEAAVARHLSPADAEPVRTPDVGAVARRFLERSSATAILDIRLMASGTDGDNDDHRFAKYAK